MKPQTPESETRAESSWTFLTNHAHVLIVLSQNPEEAAAGEITLREVAQQVGITERAVTKIIGELEEAGCITRGRQGRHNIYTINPSVPLRHAIESHRTIRDLLKLGRK